MLNSQFFVVVYILILQFQCLAQISDTLQFKAASEGCGLMFEKEVEYRLVDSSYTESIQLFNLGGKAQALQFRLLFNKAIEDSTILIFKDIQKGSDLKDPSWLMDFNVVKGTNIDNGASQDEIFVVLYNLNYDNGLLPGDYKNLFTVNYRTTKLFGFNGDIKSSIQISHAEASTSTGTAIDIKPMRDRIIIHIKGQ